MPSKLKFESKTVITQVHPIEKDVSMVRNCKIRLFSLVLLSQGYFPQKMEIHLSENVN